MSNLEVFWLSLANIVRCPIVSAGFALSAGFWTLSEAAVFELQSPATPTHVLFRHPKLGMWKIEIWNDGDSRALVPCSRYQWGPGSIRIAASNLRGERPPAEDHINPPDTRSLEEIVDDRNSYASRELRPAFTLEQRRAKLNAAVVAVARGDARLASALLEQVGIQSVRPTGDQTVEDATRDILLAGVAEGLISEEVADSHIANRQHRH